MTPQEFRAHITGQGLAPESVEDFFNDVDTIILACGIKMPESLEEWITTFETWLNIRNFFEHKRKP